MKCILEIENCTILGSGSEGSVYLSPEGYAIKKFKSIECAKKESSILQDLKDSKFYPNVLLQISNIVIRECVNGENLSSYLSKNGLSYKISTCIIDLIEDLKKFNFTRLNVRNAHIFIDNNENLKVIDPRKPYTKVTPYPKDIIKILFKLHLFDKFLNDLIYYRPDLLNYWINGFNHIYNSYTKRLSRYF